MPSSKKGPVLFIGSGPHRISQEIRGNLFAYSCIQALRDAGLAFAIMDNDAAGPLSREEGCQRLITAPVDAESIARTLEGAAPSHVWPVCAGKETQAVLLEVLEKSGRGNALPGGTGAYKAATDWQAFRDLAASVKVEVPFGRVITSIEEAAAVAGEVGFPLFLSASVSRGGGGARIVYNHEELAFQAGMLLSWSLSGTALAVRVYEKHPQCEVHVMRDAKGGAKLLGVTDALAPLGVHAANAVNVFPAQGIDAASQDAARKAAEAIAVKAGLRGYAVIHFGVGEEGPYAVGMRTGFASSSYILSLGLGLDVARAATEAAFGEDVEKAAATDSGATVAVSAPRFENHLFPGAGSAVGPHKISTGAGVGLGESFEEAFVAAAASARRGQTELFEAATAVSGGASVLPGLAAPRSDYLVDVIAAFLQRHDPQAINAASGIPLAYLEKVKAIAASGGRGDSQPREPKLSAKPGSGEKAFVLFAPAAAGVGEVDESDVVLRGLATAYLDKGYRLILAGFSGRIPLDLYFAADEVLPRTPLEDFAELANAGNVAIAYVDPRNPESVAARVAVAQAGVTLAGPDARASALVYERKSLSGILPSVGLTLKEGEEVADVEQALRAAAVYGYPLFVKRRGGDPKAVVAYTEDSLKAFVEARPGPVVVERFLEELVESAVLVLSDGKNARTAAVMEVLEESGISNVDRAGVLPPFSITQRTRELLSAKAEAFVEAAQLKGLVTVRLGVRYDVPYYLSATLGACREVPFAAFATGRDIIAAAAAIYDGKAIDEVWEREPAREPGVFIRQPVFSFGRFPGADTVLGTRPRSTGDVIGMADNFSLAYANARRSAGRPLPTEGTAFVSLSDRDKRSGMLLGRQLADAGLQIVATDGTAKALSAAGVESKVVYRVSEGRPNVIDSLKNGEISLVIYTPSGTATRQDEVQIRTVAWSLGVPVITTADEALAAVAAIEALKSR